MSVQPLRTPEHTAYHQAVQTPTTWNEAAAEAVREMIARQARPRTLQQLRDAYDGFFTPDLDESRLAAAWSEFGARCKESSVTIAAKTLLWQEVIDTVIRKQRDYGKDNILRFGQAGLEVRVHDKLARLEHLEATGATPENESVADSVLDLVGYSVLGLLVARGWFELELV